MSTYSMLNTRMKEVERTVKKALPRREKDDRRSEVDSDIIEIDPDDKSEGSRMSAFEVDRDPNEPDRSLGDFYCKICDSHMNSEAMWESHITGKRHMRNVKKGDTEIKYEEMEVDSSIKHELRNVKDPIIGLNYIHEIRRREPGVQPLYNCFLCCANLVTVPLVIEHVISVKHRMNFIKENKPKEYQLIDSAKLTRAQIEPLLTEKAALLEAEYGRGCVTVKLEKNKLSAPPKRERERDDDVIEIPKKPVKFSKFDDEKKVINLKGKDFQPKEKKYYQHDDRLEKNRYSSSYRERADIDSRPRDKDSRPSYKDEDRYLSRSHQTSSSSRNADYRNPEKYRSSEYSSRSDSRPYESSGRGYSAEYASKHYPAESASKHYPAESASKHYSAESASKNYPSLRDHSSQSSYSNPPGASTSLSNPPPDNKTALKEFVSQLLGLSKEYFLKIVLMKLQDIKDEELKKEELNVLLEVYTLSQKIIHQNLPPSIRELLRPKLAVNPQPKPVPEQPVPQPSPISMEDIASLISKLRQANTQPQQAPGNYAAVPNFSQPSPPSPVQAGQLSNSFPSRNAPVQNVQFSHIGMQNIQPPQRNVVQNTPRLPVNTAYGTHMASSYTPGPEGTNPYENDPLWRNNETIRFRPF